MVVPPRPRVRLAPDDAVAGEDVEVPGRRAAGRVVVVGADVASGYGAAAAPLTSM